MTPFQLETRSWLIACVGLEDANSKQLRNWRFLEEALELVQACGSTKEEALSLIDYVYDRPVGDKFQEVGGVMTTLHALGNAQEIDVEEAGETELDRCWNNIEKIRMKHFAKPNHGPLPM